MSRHPRVRRALILAAALALPVAFVPTVTAAAADPVPVFSYIDTSGGDYSRVLASANADGSSPVALTPDGYQTLTYEVTQDGSTAIVGLCRGTAAACYGKGVNPSYNVTYALLLVHRDAGYGTRTRVLSTWWSSRAALDDSGAAFWMVGSKLYRFAPDYSTEAWTTSTAYDTSLAFAPSAGWSTNSVAVTGDGARVAVVQWHKNGTRYDWRVVAGDFATGPASACFQLSGGTGTWEPDEGIFAFADSTHLMLSTLHKADLPRLDIGGLQEWPSYAQTATLSGTGAACSSTLVAAPALDDTYALQRFGSSWYMWNDTSGVNELVANYGATSDLSVRPSTWTPRSNGPSSYHYRLSAVTPPELVDPAVNRASAHPYLRFTSTTLLWNKRTMFSVGNYYYQPPVTGPYDAAMAAENEVGTLQYSVDAGVTWFTAARTSATSLTKVGKYYYNGLTGRLRQNTWYRWYYPGDIMTMAGYSKARVVYVLPTIAVRAVASGKYRVVYGTATRSGGKIALYRYTKKGYRYVATTTMTGKGRFTFGKRTLSRGTYKVVSLRDTWWAASSQVFKV